MKPYTLDNKAMSTQEKKWAAERDLETLIQAAKIRKDPARLKAAKECAKCRKEELADEIGAVSNIQDADKDGD